MARGNQLIRQWQLLKILQNYRYGVAIEELTDKLGHTRRTIERDLAVLRDVNFPLSCESRDFGKKYWKLEANFLTSENFLVGVTEILSMHLARQLLSPLAGTHLGDGLNQLWKKIETVLPRSAINHFADLDETLYVKVPVKEDYAAQDKFLHIIRTGIGQSKILKITYCRNIKDKPSHITFHPYGLIFFGASLYLIGFSESAKSVRTLKVPRITGAELTASTFVRPEHFSLEDCVSGSFGIMSDDSKPTTIRCKFTDWATTIIREQKWHKTQVVEKDHGDELIASFLLNNTVEFKRWILSFGSMAHVISPKALKTEIAQTLTMMIKNYS